MATAATSAQVLYADALQGFAQQAALPQWAQLPPQAPVRTDEGCPGHLVHSLQIGQSPDRLRLLFESAGGAMVSLQLQDLPLRQSLSIVYAAWTSADWPQHLWPDWWRAGQ